MPTHGRTAGACRAAGAAACSPAYLGDSPDTAPVHVVTTFLPEMAADLRALAQAAAAQGITLGFASFGGVRDQQLTNMILGYRAQDYAAYVTQLALSKPGAVPVPMDQWRPILPYGQSKHNFGAAADVFPIAWPASMPNRAAATQVVQQLAPSVGLQVPLPASDPHHVELPYPVSSLQVMWLLNQANLSSQPDVLTVAPPLDVSTLTLPGVSTIPGVDLQQLLTPSSVALTPAPLPGMPDGISPGMPSSSSNLAVAVGIGVAIFAAGLALIAHNRHAA